jgi:hypothetical protein
MTMHDKLFLGSVAFACITFLCLSADAWSHRVFVRELTEKDRRKAMQARIDALAKRYHGHTH